MTDPPMNWAAIHRDPRFQELHRRKARFLWGLMLFSIAYYFALPLGAAWMQPLFRQRICGPVNVGLAFALSEFVVAWGVAWWYERRASARFDALAAELDREAGRIGARP